MTYLKAKFSCSLENAIWNNDSSAEDRANIMLPTFPWNIDPV